MALGILAALAACAGGDDAGSRPTTTAIDGGADGTAATCDADFDRDRHHCGACNHDCFGGDCIDGTCRSVVVGRVPEDVHVAVTVVCDGDDVYASNGVGSSGGTIYALSPGKQEKEIVTGRNRAFLLFVDATYLYWFEDEGAIVRTPRASPGVVEPFVPIDAVAGNARETSVARDQSHVYFSRADGTGGSILYRVPLAGGSPERIASSSLSVGGRGADLAVGSTQFFVTSFSLPGYVWRMPRAGGPPVKIAEDISGPTDVAAVGDRAFFRATRKFDPALPERPAVFEATGGSVVEITTQEDQPASLATDADGAFWAAWLDRDLFRTALDGRKTKLSLVQLEAGAEIHRVRTEPRSVCFTASLPDAPGTQVYRIAKRRHW